MEKGEHLKRQNRPTMLQLQYLQGLSKVEKKRGAQGSIAEYYGVNRSTVNRYFKNCIERGILTESLEFTPVGEEWLERYTKLYENLEKYLEEIGAKPEEIEESLDVMVENIDIHMLELMINAYTEKKSVYKKKENELDQEIQHNLQKCERHPVVFRLYRMNKKQGQGRDSMAMRGFEEIAEIVQENGESYLELKLKEMAAHSRVSGEMMAGKLKTLKYEKLYHSADTDKIQKNVKSFVSNYNSVMESAQNSDKSGVLKDASRLASQTGNYTSALAKIGITVKSDNTLAFDEEAFASADMSDVKKLFAGDFSFGSNTQSRMLQLASDASANSSSVFYNQYGAVAGASVGSFYDSLF